MKLATVGKFIEFSLEKCFDGRPDHGRVGYLKLMALGALLAAASFLVCASIPKAVDQEVVLSIASLGALGGVLSLIGAIGFVLGSTLMKAIERVSNEGLELPVSAVVALVLVILSPVLYCRSLVII